MIITPNSVLQKQCLTTYVGQDVLRLKQWQDLLLGQTAYQIASDAIIDDIIIQLVDIKKLQTVKKYINYIYQQHIPIETLCSSTHPNSSWLGNLFIQIENSLTKQHLIHPHGIHQLLIQYKHSLDPLFDHVSAFGFEHASPCIQNFINHFCDDILEIPLRKTTHQARSYSSVHDEVHNAILWLKTNPDRALVCLDQTYQTELNLAICEHYHPNFIAIPSKQCPLIKHCIHITAINHKLSYDIIPHLKMSQSWPKGLIVSSDTQTHFPRHKNIPLHQSVSLLHMHFDAEHKMTVHTFISQIQQTLSFWNIEHLFAKTPPQYSHLQKVLQSMRSLSYLNIEKTYDDWHILFANSLQCGTLQHPDSPSVLTGHDALLSQHTEIWVLGGTDDTFSHYPKLPWLPSSSIQKTDLSPFLFHGDEIIISYQTNNPIGDANHFSVVKCDTIQYRPDHQPLNMNAEYDWSGPPLTEPLSGGISLIRDIAICPYKAFAQHRLKLFPKYTKCLSLEPQEIGNAVHDVLEHLYQSIESQQDLTQISRNHIDHYMSKYWEKHHPNTQISEIIRHDIIQRVEEWISVDLERKPFIIQSVEEKRTLQLGVHRFSIRIDRIDWVDNQPVLIDYKTGNANLNDVFSPDFSSPQMALYALTEQQPPIIAFAKIKTKSCQWQSINLGCNDSLEKLQTKRNNEPVSYDELKATWYKRAVALTEHYIQGKYKAEPSHEQHCTQCAFTAFCRYYDQGAYHHESC